MASETEATLLVCSEKPQQLMGEIAGLQSIGGYTLQDNGIEIIRDIYFDTTDLLLQKQKLAVLLRQINSSFKLTFKGPSRDVGKSSVKRTEIEEPWSEKALQNVMNELESRNIKLKQHESGDANQFDYEHDPLVVLKRLGLEIIQERVTERHAKNVVVAEDGRALAELALDSVTYHFGQRDIRVFEIEIEVKDGKSF
ncbi:MAG: CYTH domain-containing protein, partial [Nitrososphaerales archaeon]